MIEQSPPDRHIQHLREAAAKRVENTSFRSVAYAAGMSPAEFEKVLFGTRRFHGDFRRA